jgi:hypothetical protein
VPPGGAAKRPDPAMSAFEQQIGPPHIEAVANLASDASTHLRLLQEHGTDSPVVTPAPPGQEQNPTSLSETQAQKRRRQRIALIEEFGGQAADFKAAAVAALKRGIYSPSTNLGDIESALIRTWRRRRRLYKR